MIGHIKAQIGHIEERMMRFICLISNALIMSAFVLAAAVSIEGRRLSFQTGVSVGPSNANSDFRPKIVESWARVLVFEIVQKEEDAVTTLSVYDFDGRLKSSPLDFIGEAHVLKMQKRIVVAQTSSHFMINKSYLLNENGEKLKEIPQHPNTFGFGFSDDGNIFWSLSAHVASGRPLNRIRVFDFDGNPICKKDFSSPEEFKIRTRRFNKRYTINIPAPDFPG
jgi:hypothetical protein